ncbi:glucose-1-phosphate thymidylyltransferase [bacterium]|nr:glucose-1-phosphate thymidylyltransferase [bacterium]
MSNRKGIILAGGSGTRLHPITISVSKQLLPVHDKPMIYYPLTTLMLIGIKEVLIITTPRDVSAFKNLLGDGSQFGMKFEYKVQSSPDGIAQAFLIAEDFLDDSPATLILGDNLFHGDLLSILKSSDKDKEGATLFAYSVNDPERYGVIEIGENNLVKSIEEKPKMPKSRYVVTGLYFYDNTVINKAKSIKKSKRGELEITDLNKLYMQENKLKVQILEMGTAWLDTGTCDSLHEASSYIRTLEHRQGIKVGCPEEISWRQEWISNDQLKLLAQSYPKSGYGDYLMRLVNELNYQKKYSN